MLESPTQAARPWGKDVPLRVQTIDWWSSRGDLLLIACRVRRALQGASEAHDGLVTQHILASDSNYEWMGRVLLGLAPAGLL